MSLRIRWYRLLRGILHLWVRAKVLPDASGNTGAEAGQTVCYVMNDYALSSVLILDQCCEELALPSPLFPISGVETEKRRAFAVLRRMQGLLIRRRTVRRSSELLRELVEHSYAHPDQDIQLVPVTVFIGRAPDKSTGFAKALFSEHWEVAGRFRRLLSTFVNGRDTLVQFSRPISLRALVAEGPDPQRSVRKISRTLRTHFQRVRSAAIGPDLSHRRTVIDSVLKAPEVRAAIEQQSRKHRIPLDKAEKQARKYALEIAADYSYRFVRMAFFILRWFLNKVYEGIQVNHFERFTDAAIDHEIIYVPCHRSHMDYLLVSFVLYERGFVPPHVAAGVNLKLPIIGKLIRGGGAFYVRRTFRSLKLYAAVFNEYLRTILSKGVSIEYFIEGTRSRTGRLLQPRGGMLAMTVRGYLASPVRPVMFQPVYIGYEQMVEAESYIRELSGRSKRSERLSDLFKALGVLRHDYGDVHVSFGEPIYLDQMLSEFDTDWRDTIRGDEARASWINALIDELGQRIMRNINASADVNPVNLLATALLATPKLCLDEQDLLDQISLYRNLLLGGPFANTISMTELDQTAIIQQGFRLGLLQRREHALGDIIALTTGTAAGLTYLRNNVTHLFALPSLIACCLLHQRTCSLERVERICGEVYVFLRQEYYLPWTDDEFPAILHSCLEQLAGAGLLGYADDRTTIFRAEGGTETAHQLTMLGQIMLQTLERYFITIAVLSKNGSGTLTRGQLEQLCIMTAQRISQLQEFDAPEFSDRNLFKQFISTLRETGHLSSDDSGMLAFSEKLGQLGEDAKLILSKELRHAILRIAPHQLEKAVSGVEVGD
jgi:glycerol-3-phosphate O-acyltransferase